MGNLNLVFSILLVGTLLTPATLADNDQHKGKVVFESCEVCHGEQAEGNEDIGAPRLADQHDWYLRLQLENFRAGTRGVDENDDNGQIMQPMALDLTDTDISNVIAYILTLRAIGDAND